MRISSRACILTATIAAIGAAAPSARAQPESMLITSPSALRANSSAATSIAPQQFTVEAWIRPDGPGWGITNDSAGAAIVNKPREGSIGPNLASWGLHWLPANNRVLFYITNVFAQSGAGMYSNATVTPGTLAHCCGTFDGTTLRLYINGQLDNTVASPSPTVYYANDMPILIGAGNFGFGYTRNFQGLIDEVRIWDHVRTPAEIASSFDCQSAGPKPGLLAAWSFDGASMTDSAGSNLALTSTESGFAAVAQPAAIHACSNEVSAPGNCVPTVELVASDRAANDYYGSVVAISGDTAAVGALAHPDAATSSRGAVYVFSRSGTSWPQQGKIVVPGEQYAFGQAIALSGDTLGACAGGDFDGAYIFNRSGTTWSQTTRLVSGGDQTTGIALGFVGTQRMIAVVGTQYATVNGMQDAGAVYIYTLDTLQAGSVWTQVARLTAPDAAANNYFGSSIGLSGGISGATLIVSAPEATVSGFANAGAAYVFTSNNTGGVWTYQAKLTSATPHTNQYLGQGGVAVNGDTAVLDGTNGPGSAVFTRAGTAWTQGQSLPVLAHGWPQSARLIGDTLLLGMESLDRPGTGRAQLLTRPSGSGTGGAWTHRAVLRPFGGPSGDYSYGPADMSGSRIVMGDMAQIGNGTAGTQYPSAAYIFDVSALCPADFDCSGTLAVADIFSFLNTWFAGGFGADFDGDQVLAVADIFAFLNAWFAGC